MNRIGMSWVCLCVMVPALRLLAAEIATVGYRGDTAGRFPNATMPVGWDLEAGTGLVWKAEMPGKTVSGLIVVSDPSSASAKATADKSTGGSAAADRVFTMADPDTLVCLNAADGKEMWRRTVDRFSFFGEKGASLREPFLAVRQYDREKFGPYGFKKSPEYQAWVEAARAAGANPETFGPRAPNDGWQYTPSTPCSDGQRVYVMLNTGVIAAYDLEGKEVWRLVHELAYDNCSNMILHDGRLYLGGGDANKRDKEGKDRLVPGKMMALDAATGKEVWLNPEISNGGGGWGSPMAVTIAGRAVILSGGGDLVDPKTGAILAKTAAAGQHSSLAVAGDVVVANEGNHYSAGKAFIRAYRITAGGDGLSAKQIWEQPELGKNCLPIVALDDRVVVVACPGVLRSFALADGRVLDDLRLGAGAGAHCPGPSLLAVGNTLVACDPFALVAVMRPEGEKLTTVFQRHLPNESSAAEKKWKIGFVYAAPFVVGNRAYFRTNKYVYCVTTPDISKPDQPNETKKP